MGPGHLYLLFSQRRNVSAEQKNTEHRRTVERGTQREKERETVVSLQVQMEGEMVEGWRGGR